MKKLTENEIIAIMKECKSEIERRCEKASSYFHDDIQKEECQWMCDTYPEINNLSTDEFQRLWKQA